MIFFFRIWAAVLLLLSWTLPAMAEETAQLDVQFPYSMAGHLSEEIPAGSTRPLYVSVEGFHMPYSRSADVSVTLPQGVRALPGEGWTVSEDGREARAQWVMPPDYGELFSLLSVRADGPASGEEKSLEVSVSGEGMDLHRSVPFRMTEAAPQADRTEEQVPDKEKFNWYVQTIAVPVDDQGKRDDRQKDGVMTVRDLTVENLRSRLSGAGAVSWAAVFSHPAAYVLIDLRNPNRDVGTLHFKAQLTDKNAGTVLPGLTSASQSDADSGNGWGGETVKENATSALIGLNGQSAQAAVIPLYADPRVLAEGDYNLRVTLWDEHSQKVIETPLEIVTKKSMGLAAVGLSLLCAVILAFSARALRRSIVRIGARGAVTTALFSAAAFGGVAVPVTLFGDLLQVFLGPFSGLLTGLLSGVLLYLLLASLLVLFRRPGTASLFFLMKWLLSGLLFGRFTPVGILSMAVSAVVIEGALQLSGFYKKKELTPFYMGGISLLIGLCDAVITLISMEQMMFLYRLYYADWFIVLYMIINGFLYSSIGWWTGWHIGRRLQQVMGE